MRMYNICDIIICMLTVANNMLYDIYYYTKQCAMRYSRYPNAHTRDMSIQVAESVLYVIRS